MACSLQAFTLENSFQSTKLLARHGCKSAALPHAPYRHCCTQSLADPPCKSCTSELSRRLPKYWYHRISGQHQCARAFPQFAGSNHGKNSAFANHPLISWTHNQQVVLLKCERLLAADTHPMSLAMLGCSEGKMMLNDKRPPICRLESHQYSAAQL